MNCGHCLLLIGVTIDRDVADVKQLRKLNLGQAQPGSDGANSVTTHIVGHDPAQTYQR